VDVHASDSTAEDFTLPIFDPPALPGETTEAAMPTASFRDAAIDEGVALHALLERLTQGHAWPVKVPDVDVIANWLSCPSSIAGNVRTQAQTILAEPQLERFFNPALYRHAKNEMDIVFQGTPLRFDRVVHHDDAVWILDYKRNVLDSERSAYQAQLEQYRAAAQAVFSGYEVKAALIIVDGSLLLQSELT